MKKNKVNSSKKENGVFYSSNEIARFICEKCISDCLEEHSSLEDLQQIKILDNACGEGVFLVESFYILRNIYKEKYPSIKNPEKYIIENNLYGVDIEENSVNYVRNILIEISGQKADSKANIKLGNSLISDKNISSIAFDWEKEFPFQFDVIVGNPPWGASLQEKEYLRKKFPLSSFGEINSYKYFIDLSLSLLKMGGNLGLVLPDSYLEKDYFVDVRRLIVNYSAKIWNVKIGDNMFDEVNMPSAILCAKKEFSDTKQFYFADISNFKMERRIELLKDKSKEIIFDTNKPDFEKSFICKNIFYRKGDYILLESIYEQVMGVKIYQIGKGKPKQTGHELEKNAFVSNKSLGKEYAPLISQGIYRYYYENKNQFIKYGEWLAEPREWRFFAVPKIVVREIINDYIYATLISNISVVKNIAAVIIQKEKEYSLEYLLSLLCSKLFAYCLKKEAPKSDNKAFPSITSHLLKKLPIKELSLEKQQPFINAAKKMLELQKQFHEGKNQFLELLAINFDLPKVSKKLENWHELEKKDFLAALEKQKVVIPLKKQAEFFLTLTRF